MTIFESKSISKEVLGRAEYKNYLDSINGELMHNIEIFESVDIDHVGDMDIVELGDLMDSIGADSIQLEEYKGIHRLHIVNQDNNEYIPIIISHRIELDDMSNSNKMNTIIGSDAVIYTVKFDTNRGKDNYFILAPLPIVETCGF